MTRKVWSNKEENSTEGCAHLTRRVLGVVLEQICRKPFYWVGGSLFHQCRHTVQKKGHNGLVEVCSDRKCLKV